MLMALFPLAAFSFFATPEIRSRNALYMANPKPSGFANTKAGKTAILERTRALLDQSSLVIAVPAQGITKEQVDMLKKELPKATKASVVKNSLIAKASVGTPFEPIGNGLRDQNIFFFIPESEAKPTLDGFKKWQKEVKRTEENQVPRVAVMEGQAYFAKNIEAVCNLPTKKELITKIAQGIKAVPTKVAKGVKAVPDKLGRAIRAIKDKLEEEGKPSE
jgi:large subunit ribosomal protein L10